MGWFQKKLKKTSCSKEFRVINTTLDTMMKRIKTMDRKLDEVLQTTEISLGNNQSNSLNGEN